MQRKFGNDEEVVKKNILLRRPIDRFRPRLDALVPRLNGYHARSYFSSNLIPSNLSNQVNRLDNENIVHAHWINGGFVGIDDLSRINKPVVWTLHDMWPMTGGCHYDSECGRYKDLCGMCPALGSKKSDDLSSFIHRKKLKGWRGKNITIICPSNWMAGCAGKSSLFQRHRIEVIPNGIDANVYLPREANVRQKFGFSPEKKIILFGAADASDDRKGLKYIKEAIKELYVHHSVLIKNIEVAIFGASDRNMMMNLPVRCHMVGSLSNDDSLAELYSAADVFVVPSLQDNLPNTIMESLSCGTPVVGFDVGGIADLIHHKINGFLSEEKNSASLLKGIVWVLGDKERYTELAHNARRIVVENYTLPDIARRHINLYEDLLGR